MKEVVVRMKMPEKLHGMRVSTGCSFCEGYDDHLKEYIERETAIDAVSAEALERNLDSVQTDNAHRYHRAAQRVLAGIPAADVREVVHAHWRMYSYDEAICSNCGYDRSTEFESTSEAKERWSELPMFCENCGAKMRDEQEKNCSDCHYATKLKSGAYRCRRKRYDIAAKSCFKPKEGEEGTEQ